MVVGVVERNDNSDEWQGSHLTHFDAFDAFDMRPSWKRTHTEAAWCLAQLRSAGAVVVLVLWLLSHGPQEDTRRRSARSGAKQTGDRSRAPELLLFEAASEDCPIGAGPMDMNTWSQGI